MTGFQQTSESLKGNQESKLRENSSKNEPIQIDQDFEIENSTEIVEIIEESNDKIVFNDVIREEG